MQSARQQALADRRAADTEEGYSVKSQHVESHAKAGFFYCVCFAVAVVGRSENRTIQLETMSSDTSDVLLYLVQVSREE